MKQILKHNSRIRSELEDFIRAKKSETSTPWKNDFLDRLLPYATTGKLLRGSLVCFGYEAFSGQPIDDSVVKAAIALELAHSALLMHDDIMDDDDLRRGQPSLHAQYRSLGENRQLAQPENFGVGMAICGGDMALFMAFELLAGIDADTPIRTATQHLFTEQLAATCAGQMQDLYLEAQNTMPSKEALYDLMQTKTAAYTIALPLAMGAALAGQQADMLAKLRAIGIAAGTIFQIRDDELGVLGNPRATGKPAGSDIIEGKKTLIYYYLLEQCNAKERQVVESVFGNPASSAEDIASIRNLIHERGIPDLLNNEINGLESQAFGHIEELEVSPKIKKELIQLVRFCSNRQS